MKKNYFLTLTLSFFAIANGICQSSDLLSARPTQNNPVSYGSSRLAFCGYVQVGNSFENGRISTKGVSEASYNGSCADDIVIPAGGCWNVNNVSFNQFCGAPPVGADITFLSDAGGTPGSIVSQTISVPFTYVALGTNFGFTIYKITCTLPTTVSLCAGASPTTYWLSCQADDGVGNTYWENQTVTNHNIAGGFFASPEFTTWTYNAGDNFVFSINDAPITTSQTFVQCPGFSVTVGTSTYNTSGTYSDILTSFQGCDSTVTTNLTIKSVTTGSQTLVGCSGYSVTVGSATHNTTGVFSDILTGFNGCDSTVTTNLTINNSVSTTQTLSGCTGYSVTVGTSTYTSTGVYTNILTAANGCDSTVTTNLTVNSPVSASQTLTGCTGYSVTVGTSTYTTTGVYTNILTAANGCDSTLTTNLTVNSVDASTSLSGLTISANATGAAYQWLNCGTSNSIITGEISQDYTATTNGTYAVEVTENGCVDTSACVAIMSVGVSQEESALFSVYPNPTDGLISLSFAGMVGTFSYTVSTVEGKVISQAKNFADNVIVIDLNSVAKGMYFLKIENNDSVRSYKIIKK